LGQRLGSRDEVCRPAEQPFDLFVGIGHRLGVQAHAGHDEEDLLLVVVAAQRADVDATVGPGDDDIQGSIEVIDGQFEVAGQQVAGATGKQPQRGIGVDKSARDRPDRAVTPERANDLGAVLDGLAGLAGAGVVLGRLVPPSVGPTMSLTGGRDGGLDLVKVVELGGIDDDRQLHGTHARTVPPRLVGT
jgi:hypothetical protein